MSRAVIALFACAACAAEEPAPSEPVVTSHVEVAQYLEHPRPRFDMLVVVDNTQAMAPHQAKLLQLTANLASVINGTARGLTDMRILVTTTDGGPSPVLTYEANWFGVHTSSFSGSLENALVPLVDVTVTATPSATPLATMRTALESSPGFLRDNAGLVIVMISAADDASPSFDYVSYVKQLKSNPANVVVIGIQPPSSPNLEAFFQGFTNRNASASLDGADYSPALELMRQLHRTTLEGSCLTPPADLDLETPGEQVDCIAMAWDDGKEMARVPMCNGADPVSGSCWEIVDGNESGCTGGYRGFALRGLWTWYLRPSIQVQCAL
jgi:hypothetical protein